MYVIPNAKLKLRLIDRNSVKNLEDEVLAQTTDNTLTALSKAVIVPIITIANKERRITLELSSFIESKDHIIIKENPLDKFESSKCLKAIDMFNKNSRDRDFETALNWLEKEPPRGMYGLYDVQ